MRGQALKKVVVGGPVVAVLAFALMTPGVRHAHHDGDVPHSHAHAHGHAHSRDGDGRARADTHTHGHAHGHGHSHSHHGHRHRHRHGHAHGWGGEREDAGHAAGDGGAAVRSERGPTSHTHFSILWFTFTVWGSDDGDDERAEEARDASRSREEDAETLRRGSKRRARRVSGMTVVDAPSSSVPLMIGAGGCDLGPGPGASAVVGGEGAACRVPIGDEAAVEVPLAPPAPPPRAAAFRAA